MLSAIRHASGYAAMPRTTIVRGTDAEVRARFGFDVSSKLPDEEVERFGCWIAADMPDGS